METEFLITVELSSEASELLVTEVLRFSSQPSSIEDVKAEIEERCCVPECVQTILYQGCVLSDGTCLQSLGLRSGDTLRVNCPQRGSVKEVKTVVKWLQKSTEILLLFHKAKEYGVEEEISNESEAILSDQSPLTLLRKLFTPWSDSSTAVNAQHFDYLGGLQQLVNLHEILTKLRKNGNEVSDRVYLPSLEFFCCKGIANFAMNVKYARRVAACGGLDSCINSFLFKAADDIDNTYVILIEAFRAILNIAELPEVHHQLALRHDVINQAFLMTSIPIYSNSEVTLMGTVCYIVCLSRCPEAHKKLLNPELVENLTKVWQVVYGESREVDDDYGKSKLMAITCYVAVALAQMICKSSYLLQEFSVSQLEKMSTIMKLACEGKAAMIRTYGSAYYWETFLPCLRCLYEPFVQLPKVVSTCESSSLIENLCKSSVDVLLQYLVVCLGRKRHVDIIVQESLTEFVTCLPWIVPPESKARGKEVLSEIGKFQKIQPPSLVSITKAYLAKTKWGLKKLMDMNSISDLYTDL